jgi:hypothetical protein
MSETGDAQPEAQNVGCGGSASQAQSGKSTASAWKTGRRGPAGGSGLSLSIPSWHAALSDPGEFGHRMVQNVDADIAFAEF